MSVLTLVSYRLNSKLRPTKAKLRVRRNMRVKNRGRALLSYLVEPVKQAELGVSTVRFSNDGAAVSWARTLSELGYDVDVINWDNQLYSSKKKYGVVVYHGGKNFTNLKPILERSGVNIYYSTGSYWRFHNKNELERFRDFSIRNHVELLPDRHIDEDEEAANKYADAIISLGNDDTAKTYSNYPVVHSIQGASYPDDHFLHAKKNYSEAKKNFLFLSGPGNIHKGLDLVLESFRKLPGLHLHIMSSLDPDFKQFYHKDLYESKNVHTYGYINQRSTQFYEVVDKCAFSILASCSEGSPGSVIESMQQGLIPIVSHESHIDLPDASMYVLDNTIPNIIKKANDLSKVNDNTIKRLMSLSFNQIAKNYTIETFEGNLKKILIKIIDKANS